MTDNWGFYERRTSNEILRVLVNIGHKSTAPLANYTELLSITVNLYPVRAQSRNNRQFIRQLEQLESNMEQWLKSSADAIYIGRINAATRLEFYYYLSEGRLNAVQLREWLDANWENRAQSYIKTDADWEFYRFLLPDALEEMFVHNAQMIYALIHKGDQITQPRRVYHWLLFQKEAGRADMESRLQKSGYAIERDKESKPEQDDYPYSLVVSRFEDVKLDTVNSRVRELHGFLEGTEARYDGWGAAMRLSRGNRFRLYLKRRKDAARSMLRRMFARHSQANQNQAGKR